MVNGMTFLLSVHRVGDCATIDVSLDDQLLIHWGEAKRPRFSRVSPYIQQVAGVEQRFFLSTRSLATFHSAQLRIVSGKAKWVK